jgi:hypothetical protein
MGNNVRNVNVNVTKEKYGETLKFISKNNGKVIQHEELKNYHNVIVEISEEKGLLILTKYSMNTML